MYACVYVNAGINMAFRNPFSNISQSSCISPTYAPSLIQPCLYLINSGYIIHIFVPSSHKELPNDTFISHISSDLNFLHEIMHVVIPIFIGYLHIQVLKTKCRCLVYLVLLKVNTLPLFPQICERKKTFVSRRNFVKHLKLS
jgi:hypothetical protein